MMQVGALVRGITALVVTICFSILLSQSPALAQGKYAAIVVDADSGRVLHAQDADALRYPASLTKMMTLYMTFDALNSGQLQMNQPLKVSAHAAAQPYGIELRAGQTITVRDAVLAAITKSANNATAVLAEAIGGTEAQFAQMATRRAHQLGMSRTTFKNSSGLPNKQQQTTARDMATLGMALIKNHAKYYHYFSTAEFQWKEATIRNHNHVLARYEGADGIKTGFIAASGFNLVASAKRDGRRVLAVVFGGPSIVARDNRMIQLLDAGFERIGKPGNDPVMASVEPAPAFSLISSAQAAETGSAARAAKPKTNAKAEAAVAKAPAQAQVGGKGKKQNANGSWAVQLGAFKKQDAAQATVAKAQAKVPTGEPTIETLRADSGMLYRARLTGLTEADARSACSNLKRKNLTCTVVSPSAG